MSKRTTTRGWMALILAGLAWPVLAQDEALDTIPVQEAEGDAGWNWFDFSGMDFRQNGFLRIESAFNTSGLVNPNNQEGNPFNTRVSNRESFCPPNLSTCEALGVQKWGDMSLSAVPAFSGVVTEDNVKRNDFYDFSSAGDDFNYNVLRAESEMQLTFNENFALIGRVRALYAPRVKGFDARAVDGIQGGITGGVADLYTGMPNQFQYIVQGDKTPIPLEFSGEDYQVYFPALVLDYSQGPVNVRVGNQSVAWGQSIFFRVFDIANGLDYRRHLIIDRGLEEYADERQPQLSVRTTWQMTDTILVDAYGAKFQPTVYPNPGTPYNVIPVQFTVQDRFHEFGYDKKTSYGIRFKGDYGQFGWQAAYVKRWNPDGTFSWTPTRDPKPLFGGLGELTNDNYNNKFLVGSPGCPGAYDPSTCRLYANSAEAMAHAPFNAGPGGVYSADEWFDYAAAVRLNGLAGLNAAIEEHDGAMDMFASPIDLPAAFGGNVSYAESRRQAEAQLDTFFLAAGGSLRGHIERLYHQEDVYALGGSYVHESDNDFLNQLIFNLEVQYTPERHFTNTTLSKKRIVDDEYTVSLVVDKWHRLFQEFPGTYLVFQALTKNRSDLVGRHLSGYGGTAAGGPSPTGKTDNATYYVFGFLQPWPNKIWALEFSTLFDPEGGILVQPLVQWNAGKGITAELFYNFIDGNLYGNPNDNLVSTLNFAEEVAVRLAYSF